MANIKSQIKRNRQNEKRRGRNKAIRSEINSRVKNALQADGGDEEALRLAIKKIDKGHEKAENLFIENLEAEENGVSQWVTYLNVVASVAPMIGLLGTVSGMISAFQTIGRGGMGRPELLAGDIGEALITTATGLVIGIPAMIAYFILRNRLNSAMIATAQAGTNLIEAVDDGSQVPLQID